MHGSFYTWLAEHPNDPGGFLKMQISRLHSD